MKLKKQRFFCVFIIYIAFTVFGCTTSKQYLAHPEFKINSKKIKTVLLIPPDIKIYELSAGGATELMDDWSRKGEENVKEALLKAFKNKSREIKELVISEDFKEEIDDIQALYRVISFSEEFVVYRKNKDFDYSVGSIEWILKKYEADALIIVNGFDHRATTGRKAAGIATALLYGNLVYIGVVTLNIGVVGPTGTILWKKSFLSPRGGGGYDFRNGEDAAYIVETILSDFWLNK